MKGTVQGVGFRAATLREAVRIGNLSGWVRNLSGGEVEILVQGARADVEKFVLWSRLGPPASRVDEVVETTEPVDPSLGVFEIRK